MTAWSSVLKGANVTLSNSNKTATFASGSQSVRSDRSLTSAKTYFEVVMTTMPSTGCIGIGAPSNASMAYTALPGADNYSVGYRSDGTVKINNSNVTTIMTFAAGDNIGVAVDLVNQKIWFRKNGGNWNNAVIGSQDPANNVGGVSLATMITSGQTGSGFAGLLIWGGMTFTTSAVLDAKFDSADWSYSAPSGYSAPDAVGATAVAIPHYDKISNPIMTPATGGYAVMLPWAKPTGGKDRFFGPSASSTTVSGNVTESGTPVANKTVRLYDATTGEFLAEVLTDGSGNFSFPGFSKPSVMVVCRDNPNYNAQVYDLVVPA